MRYRLDLQEVFYEVTAFRSFIDSRRRELQAQRRQLEADREEMKIMFDAITEARRRLGMRSP